MARHPYKLAARAKREARAESERRARQDEERRRELAPFAHAARGVTFAPDYVSTVGAAFLAAFEREGV